MIPWFEGRSEAGHSGICLTDPDVGLFRADERAFTAMPDDWPAQTKPLERIRRFAPPGLCHYQIEVVAQVSAQLPQQTDALGEPLSIAGTVERNPVLFILRVP
jgi:hypothetical protein